MKPSLKLTTDGLMRALRTHMHRMADDIEAGYVETRERGADGDAERRGNSGGGDGRRGD